MVSLTAGSPTSAQMFWNSFSCYLFIEATGDLETPKALEMMLYALLQFDCGGPQTVHVP